MTKSRMIDCDAVRPTEIEHKCEEMFDGDKLMQKYNYVVYHFENGDRYYWARAYMEDIYTVSLFGPLDSRQTRKPLAAPVDDGVLAYLKRRFATIQALGEDGYIVVWSRNGPHKDG